MDAITRLGNVQFQIENMEKQLKELKKIKCALVIGINIENAESQQMQNSMSQQEKTTLTDEK